MVKEYGMSPHLGHIHFAKERHLQFPDMGLPAAKDYSEQTAQVVEKGERAYTFLKGD